MGGLRFLKLNMNFPEYQLDHLAQTDALLRAGEDAGIFFTLRLDDSMNIADFNPLVSTACQETVYRAILAAKKLLPLRAAIT